MVERNDLSCPNFDLDTEYYDKEDEDVDEKHLSTLPNAKEGGSRKTGELRSACDLCSTSKKKCDGRKPSCTNCARKNLVCVYRVRRPRGPAKGAKYKPRKKREDLLEAAGFGRGGMSIGSGLGSSSSSLTTVKRAKTEAPQRPVPRQGSWNGSCHSNSSYHDSTEVDHVDAIRYRGGQNDDEESTALTISSSGSGGRNTRLGSPYSPRLRPSLATGFAGIQENLFITHMLQSFGSLIPISSERSLRQSLFRLLMQPDKSADGGGRGRYVDGGNGVASTAVLWATIAVGALLLGSNLYQLYLRRAIHCLRDVSMLVCEDVVRAHLMVATAYGMVKNMEKFAEYGGAGMTLYQCISADQRSESLVAAVLWYQHIMADPMADPFKYKDVIEGFDFPKLMSSHSELLKLESLGQVMSGCETFYTKCWLLQMQYEASGEGEMKQGPLYTDFVQSMELKILLETSIRTIMESPHPSSSMTLCGIMSWYVFQRALAEEFKESIQWAELVADALVADSGCLRLEAWWHYAHVLCYVLSRFSFGKYSALAYQHNLYTEETENRLPANPDELNPMTCCKLSICQDLCIRMTGIWAAFDLQKAMQQENLSAAGLHETGLLHSNTAPTQQSWHAHLHSDPLLSAGAPHLVHTHSSSTTSHSGFSHTHCSDHTHSTFNVSSRSTPSFSGVSQSSTLSDMREGIGGGIGGAGGTAVIASSGYDASMSSSLSSSSAAPARHILGIHMDSSIPPPPLPRTAAGFEGTGELQMPTPSYGRRTYNTHLNDGLPSPPAGTHTSHDHGYTAPDPLMYSSSSSHHPVLGAPLQQVSHQQGGLTEVSTAGSLSQPMLHEAFTDPLMHASGGGGVGVGGHSFTDPLAQPFISPSTVSYGAPGLLEASSRTPSNVPAVRRTNPGITINSSDSRVVGAAAGNERAEAGGGGVLHSGDLAAQPNDGNW